MLNLTIWFLLAVQPGAAGATLVAAFQDPAVCRATAAEIQREHNIQAVCKPGEYILKGTAL